jgi:flagellar biosynthetic protein FliR
MLVQLLPAEVFAFFIVFARVGAAVMLMPGFGEVYVPARFRLIVAGAITLLLTPVLGAALPAMPDSPLRLLVLIFGESLTGAFLGLVGRIILSALHTAGTVLAFQTGIANALGYDPIAAEQSAITALFLSTAGVLLVFTANLHHVILSALASSYNVLPAGALPPIDGFSQVITRLVADTFVLGVQLAAPFIVVGLVFYLGVGLLARLMPQVQVFFIAMPIQIFLGFSVFALTAGVMLAWFADRFPDMFNTALGG